MYTFFSRSTNTYRPLGASHGSHMKGCTCFIREEAHRNERFISCDGTSAVCLQGAGVDLKVKGVHYIEMHCGLHTC